MKEIDFLEGLIAIPSPSREEDAVADFLLAEMGRMGYAVQRDGVGNVLGRLGDTDAERTIVLLGHMDTVPGHIPVRRRNGRLFGRGAVDAKGPLAVLVLAASRVASQLEDTCLLVIGAVEEEAHGKGARHLAATVPAPYCAVIGEPSGWDGVTLGYKGMLSLDYRLVQPGGHSASEESGPAEKAVSLWNRIMTFAETHNRGRAGHFDTLDPALLDFSTFSDGLRDGVDMSITVRIPLGLRAVELKQKVEGWSNGAQVRFYPSDPPFQAEKNTPLVRGMLRGIRARGGRPRFKLKTGTSDMNIVGPVWGCPIVAYGPGDSSLDHTPNEHIEIAEFRRAIDVMAHALQTLLA